jgi:hypothetical protein
MSYQASLSSHNAQDSLLNHALQANPGISGELISLCIPKTGQVVQDPLAFCQGCFKT